MNTCLSIAGSDPSGGAGIQADLKTMTVNGVYAMCAITALTVQNTLGVTNILEVGPEFLGQQLDAVFQDIRPDAVKVGMVSSAGLIRVIAQKLRQYGAQNVVVDPVMVSTSGSRLLESDAAAALREELFPLAAVVTPKMCIRDRSKGPLPWPRSSMAARAPERYALAFVTAVSRSWPLARFAAMALERVQPVPWVLGLPMRWPKNHRPCPWQYR